jgi:glutamyl-tRNA reductase
VCLERAWCAESAYSEPVTQPRDRSVLSVVTLVVVGLNHRSVPLAVFERLTVPADGQTKALHDLATRAHLTEVVLLSTCNRTEVYALAEKFHGAYGDIRDFLCDLGGLAPEDFADDLYAYHDDAAARHLFGVAAGLDSAVLGESEILGQVRTAWEHAQEQATVGSALNLVMRRAIEVGKRARTETSIGRHIASVSHAAVAMASERLGELSGAHVLVVGAGEMGEGMAVSLAGAGVARMSVANRTRSRADALAERVGGDAIALNDVPSLLGAVDLVLTSTAANEAVVTYDDVLVARASATTPLLIVDIAVPRNVDPSVASIDGVSVLDLNDLRSFAERGLAERRGEVMAVSAIVEDELVRWQDELSARSAAPLVTELRSWAEAVRFGELDRAAGRLVALDDVQRETVDAITKAIVNKLLHHPTIELKDAAGTPKGDRLAAAVRELFDL